MHGGGQSSKRVGEGWVEGVLRAGVSVFYKSGILKLGRGEMKDLYVYKRSLVGFVDLVTKIFATGCSAGAWWDPRCSGG